MKKLCFILAIVTLLISYGTINIYAEAKKVETKAYVDLKAYGGYSAAFSPDSKNLTIATYDKKLSIYDVKGGNLLVAVNTGSISKLDYSKDGRKIITCEEEFIRIYDSRSGVKLFEYTEAGFGVSYGLNAIFNREENSVIILSKNKVIEIEISTNKKLSEYALINTANIIQLHPNKDIILIGFNGGYIQLRNSISGELIKSLSNNDLHVSDSLYKFSFSVDGKYIFAGDNTYNTLKIIKIDDNSYSLREIKSSGTGSLYSPILNDRILLYNEVYNINDLSLMFKTDITKTLSDQVLFTPDGQVTLFNSSLYDAKQLASPVEIEVRNIPAELKATPQSLSIKLDWKAPINTENIIGYYLYRGTEKGNYSATPITDFPVKETTYEDKNINNGQKYYYVCKAVNKDKTLSASSNEIEAQTTVNANSTVIVLRVGNSEMQVNGQSKLIDSNGGAKPVIINGRTLVPIRAIIEALGGNVNWIAEEKKVDLNLDGIKIEMWVDKKNAKVNNKDVEIDVPPMIISERTMIPLRFVSENFKCTIDWDTDSQKITILKN